MIIYRRVMMNIAEKIINKEGAKAIVTGDSLSQVASQTLENLSVIHSATTYLVLAPLLGESKNSIIKLSKEIGTYDLSIMPYRDCCSYMVAKHPQIKSKIADVEELEKNLDESKFASAVEGSEVKQF